MTLVERLVARFAALEDELNGLDAVAGDGDHGSTMLRGLRAAVAGPDPVVAFRTAAGGASGSLFAQLLAALLAHEAGEPLPAALARAATRIGAVGQAKPGDRTMLDALIPASLAADAPTAAQAALTGAEATRQMPARKGRAKHVEGAGLGHVDAGARSVAEMLAVLAGETV
jgi:phosphoenolpyruvate---glycerone phosphotransferase subunit DhaL